MFYKDIKIHCRTSKKAHYDYNISAEHQILRVVLLVVRGETRVTVESIWSLLWIREFFDGCKINTDVEFT